MRTRCKNVTMRTETMLKFQVDGASLVFTEKIWRSKCKIRRESVIKGRRKRKRRKAFAVTTQCMHLQNAGANMLDILNSWVNFLSVLLTIYNGIHSDLPPWAAECNENATHNYKIFPWLVPIYYTYMTGLCNNFRHKNVNKFSEWWDINTV